jgi:hydroxyethylthiazole kinase
LDKQICANALKVLRTKRPLVHHITNYVTVNDCANITMCVGAAPVMADAIEEVGQMVSVAGALVLNIGTLNSRTIESMIVAGKEANRLGIPIVLDPVGAGATDMRTKTVRRLLEELHISVLKGNAGEIGVIAGSGGIVKGVDSEGMKGDPTSVVKNLAASLHMTVAMSGVSDIVSDGRRTVVINNGNAMMGKISGTGCMVASVVGAFSAVCRDPVEATTSAFVTMDIAGELAASNARGPGSFKVALFDEAASLTPENILERAKMKEV